MAATIKVNKETPVEDVTFEDAYKDSTWNYNEEKEQLTIKATRKDDATASGEGTIAQIKVKVPGTLENILRYLQSRRRNSYLCRG